MTDQTAFNTSSNEIQGLNTKVTITPEMLRNSKRTRGRVSYTPSDSGFLLLVTSGHGGVGKSSYSYLAAQDLAQAYKMTNSEKKAILIEGDWETPKLQNRLGIPRGRDLSALAKLLEEHRNSMIPEAEVNERAEEIMRDIIWQDPSTGLHVIACPYEQGVNAESLKEALKKTVLWAQRAKQYSVVLDFDSIGVADGLSLDFVEMANRIVIISDVLAPKVIKKRFLWKVETIEVGASDSMAHVQDALNLVSLLMRPTNEGGYNIDGHKIRVFFNDTAPEDYQAKIVNAPQLFPKNMVIGNCPPIEEIRHGWVGNMKQFENVTTAMLSVGESVLKATQSLELDRFLRELASQS